MAMLFRAFWIELFYGDDGNVYLFTFMMESFTLCFGSKIGI